MADTATRAVSATDVCPNALLKYLILKVFRDQADSGQQRTAYLTKKCRNPSPSLRPHRSLHTSKLTLQSLLYRKIDVRHRPPSAANPKDQLTKTIAPREKLPSHRGTKGPTELDI
jgi:hypothetical protein